VEHREDPAFPEATVYRRRDSVLAQFRAFSEAFDRYWLEK